MSTEYKTISDLDAASDAQVTSTTLVEIAAASGGSFLSKKATMAQLKAYATSELKADVGDLSDLDTTVKTDLVSAINEVAQGGGGGSSPSPYTSNPASLGTASPGSSANYSRGDHVHPKPSAADLGVIAAPSSPATGAFLVWSGSAWVAQTLSTWQGGSY